MWKIMLTIALLGFASTQAQEFCIQCASNETNSDCVFPERLDSFSLSCTNATGFCFTRVLHTGFIQRGCGSELETTECDGELCNRCPLIEGVSVPCNNMILPVDRLTCYTCSGDNNSTCGLITRNSTNVHPQLCPLFRNDDRCVATRNGNIVQRGCFSSMNNVQCDVTHNCCVGHACNHWEWNDVRDSALSIHSALKLGMIALVAVIVGYNNL